MTNTPDRFPGDDLVDDAVIIDNDTVEPSIPGSIKYVNGRFHLLDSVGIYDPRDNETVTTAAGLTAANHAKLRQLIHFIDEGPAEGFTSGAYKEVTGGIFPTTIIWYTASNKTQKIVQKDITYNSSKLPTIISWSVYNESGSSVIATASDSITYSGPFETSRTRSIADYSISSDVLTTESHKSVRQLIHLADGVGGPFEGFPTNAYRETLPSANAFPTSIIWYDDSTKAKKIVSKEITRNSAKMATTITWKAYDVDGVTVLSSVTDTITYINNLFEESRSRTIS